MSEVTEITTEDILLGLRTTCRGCGRELALQRVPCCDDWCGCKGHYELEQCPCKSLAEEEEASFWN